MSSYNVVGGASSIQKAYKVLKTGHNSCGMNALPYAFYRAWFFSDFEYVPFSINSPELERFLGYTCDDWRDKYLVSVRQSMFQEYKHRSSVVRKVIYVAKELEGLCSFASAAYKYLKLARTVNNPPQSTNIRV